MVDEVKLHLELCGVGFLKYLSYVPIYKLSRTSFYQHTIIHKYIFILLDVDIPRGKCRSVQGIY